MSFSSLLCNVVSIERPSQAYSGGVPTETFTSIAVDVKCNIQYIQSKGFQPSEGGDYIIEGWMAFFEYGINIEMRDKLVDELGRIFIVQTSPSDVVGKRHHLEIQLELQE